MRWRSPAVVVNPSKLDDPRANHHDVERMLGERGIPEPRWYDTTPDDPGLGQTEKALADGADLVLVQGGDGTVRACAAALVGGDVPLGLMPAGTGNLLARNLGVPRDLHGAVKLLATGRTRAVDVVSLDDEPFVVMGGSGFDALMFELTSEDLKSRVGWAAYVVAGMRAVRAARPYPVEVELDGAVETMRAVGVVVGNVGTLTAGIPLVPSADPDDGRLHVAVLTPLRLRDWVGLGARLVTRASPRPFQMRVMSAREAVVRWPRPLPAEVDGDLVDDRETLRFAVRPASLRVCVPTEDDVDGDDGTK